MKKRKRCIVSFLLIACLLFSTKTYASDDIPDLALSEETKIKEQKRILGEIPPGEEGEEIDWKLVVGAEHQPSPRYVCINCNWFCVTVCAAEGVRGDEWDHSTLFTKDCHVTSILSRGAMMCPTCYTVWEQYDYHYCWEVHTKCSKGQYDICPMQVT